MRVRSYGLLLLGLAGMAPLALYGTLAVQRSQRVAIEEVRESNQFLAQALAQGILAHLGHQRELLATIGVAALESTDPALTLEGIRLSPEYEHLHDIAVYRVVDDRLHSRVGQPALGLDPEYWQLAVRVIAGDREPLSMHGQQLADFVLLAHPVMLAGARTGVVVARYDMVGIWRSLGAARIGDSGFARVVSSVYGTLAHGDSDERRTAFMDDDRDIQALLAAANSEQTIDTFRGDEVIASAIALNSLNWGNDHTWYVVVERSVDEAYQELRAVTAELILAAAVGLFLVALIGFFVGRTLVQFLERLRAHTDALADDLDARFEHRTKLVELQSLGNSLDTMAEELSLQRQESVKRERLATFSRVAAGLAHDLRLPIEAVRGACDWVVSAPDDGMAHDLLRKVNHRELPRLKRFVDDLQRLARDGDLELEAVLTEPRALADEISAELSGAAKWRDVQFVVAGDADALRLDRELVRRALINLASNAADACVERGPGNQVSIEVVDCTVGERQDAVELRVSDTGNGIPEDRLLALEESDFYSTKRSTGVGLGLSVVRQVVHTHGGTLHIESSVGVGSRFTMRLPRKSVMERSA